MRPSTCFRYTLVALLSALWTQIAWGIGSTPPGWKPRETVAVLGDPNAMVGADRALAYDHHGNPGIAFSNALPSYARRVPGVGWASTSIPILFATHPSLAFDRYERPAMSYFDVDADGDTFPDLGYSRFNGSIWISETVDTYSPVGAVVGQYSSIAFDLLGRPAIAYFDNSATSLKFVQDTDGDLSLMDETPVTVINAFNEGQFSSLVFDDLNRPMVAHFDDTNDDLRFSVQEPGVGWVTTTVDSTGNTGRYPSIAIDPNNGFPAIAYHTNTELRFTAWDGDSWNQTTVDTTGSVLGPGPSNYQSSPSLAFDPADGNPAIAYGNNTDGRNLKLAWRVGNTWNLQTVDAVGDVGRNPSLAFNDYGNGFPSITYLDWDEDLFESRLYYIEDPPAAVPEPASAMLLMAAALTWFVSVALRRPNHFHWDHHES